MSTNTSWNGAAVAAVVIVVVAAALGGGFLYGRDTNRGDGNDIRVDMPDRPRKR